MRAVWLALGLGCALPACAAAQTARRPVVVELFTSQGCSSCPPADGVVADLARTRPDLLPLTFHVTYWNNLGWQDPFSFEAATERQRRYVALSISPQVYTPAMVIDGRQDVVGSDRAAVEAMLAHASAAAQNDAPVEIVRAATGVSITIGAGTGHGTILLLGYDRQHLTQVGRGENSGRTLLEANIVRSMTVAGSWAGEKLHLSAAMPAAEEVAVLVQADNGGILGAARLAASASQGLAQPGVFRDMMIPRLLPAALLAAGLGLGTAQAAVVQPYQQSVFAAAQHSEKPILIFVEAPWCPTCAKERPILARLYDTPEFADLQVFTVDFDTSKPLLHDLNVRMQSTLIVYHGGRETARATGVTDPDAIRKLLETSRS